MFAHQRVYELAAGIGLLIWSALFLLAPSHLLMTPIYSLFPLRDPEWQAAWCFVLGIALLTPRLSPARRYRTTRQALVYSLARETASWLALVTIGLTGLTIWLNSWLIGSGVGFSPAMMVCYAVAHAVGNLRWADQ